MLLASILQPVRTSVTKYMAQFMLTVTNTMATIIMTITSVIAACMQQHYLPLYLFPASKSDLLRPAITKAAFPRWSLPLFYARRIASRVIPR